MKQIIVSVWGIILTLATYLFFSSPSDSVTGSVSDDEIVMETHKTDTLSISIFDRGEIIGHFVARIRFQLPKGLEKQFPIPITFVIGDGLNQVLNEFNAEQIRTMKAGQIDSIETRLATVLGNRRTPLPVKHVELENARVMLKQ